MSKEISKIEKIFRKAKGNANKHEAETALAMAHEMMLKYNITEAQLDANRESAYTCEIYPLGAEIPRENKYVARLIQQFYFVKLIFSKRGRNEVLLVFGRKENVEVAIFIYEWLTKKFKSLFHEYRMSNDVRPYEWDNYYFGLYNGIVDMLQAAREAAESSMALVVVEDAKLDEYVKETVKPAGVLKDEAPAQDTQATRAGYSEGVRLEIVKGKK